MNFDFRCGVFVLAAVVLLGYSPAASAIPKPVRDTTYDWRCVRMVGNNVELISLHTQQYTAVFRCQTEKMADPAGDFFVEPGRYRMEWEPPAASEQIVEPVQVNEPVQIDEPAESTGALSIRWRDPSENVDGSPVDLDFVRVTAVGPQTVVGQAPAGAQTLLLTDVVKGRYVVHAVAVSRSGNESAKSNEIIRTVR